jgi:hypothetical protein
MAGFGSFVGDHGTVQNPTMIFRMMGVDVPAFLAHYGPDTIMGEDVSALIRSSSEAGSYASPRSKIWLFTTTRPGDCSATAPASLVVTSVNSIRFFIGTSPKPKSMDAPRSVNMLASSSTTSWLRRGFHQR